MPIDGAAGPQYYLKPVGDLLTGLDPDLQKAILDARAGEAPNPANASVGDDQKTWVDVTARLKNPDGEIPPRLLVAEKLGAVVTGRVAVEAIQEVRQHGNISSLKAAAEVHADLLYAVPDISCDAQTLQAQFQPPPGHDGSGVVVGIVDEGGDFAHPNFLANGQTRLLYLWDQQGGKVEGSSMPYGREFSAAQIDAALQQGGDPYSALGYDPTRGAHGTHVMDVAAGNGSGTGVPGVAPKADLIFVHVGAPAKGSLSNSRRLLEAVQYIFEKAGDRPAVVNVSLASNEGPHDGSTPDELGFTELLE
jgi:subtilisin family serine protease